MTLPAWLRALVKGCEPRPTGRAGPRIADPPGEKRARIAARLLLLVAVLWACFRTARSVGMLFSESHDLDIYYSLWFLLKHRDYADIALGQALYLPHTWLVLTPLFLLGWPASRLLMLLLNVACVIYIWWRLSQLAGLAGIRRWLMLALFWGWLGTGLIVGLGNLALVCVAAAVAAYPFTTTGNSVFLMLSAMKQSLIFPLYLHLLFKRPKVLLLPFTVFALSGIAILLWSRLGLTEGLKLAQASAATANAWTLYDFTCMRRLLAPFIHNATAVSVVMWLVWFGLFGVCAVTIKEPLTQFAALLLLSLLPMYHQRYDLIAAAPALALCLRRGSLFWPSLMTIALATDFGITFSRYLPPGALRTAGQLLELAYYPLLTLGVLLALIYLDRIQARPVSLIGAKEGMNQPKFD
jgi:hypothetical protein